MARKKRIQRLVQVGVILALGGSSLAVAEEIKSDVAPLLERLEQEAKRKEEEQIAQKSGRDALANRRAKKPISAEADEETLALLEAAALSKKHEASFKKQATKEAAPPAGSLLRAPYPSPFNSTAVIPYHLPEGGEVKIAIYNALGQKITTLVNQFQAAGTYDITWHGKDTNGRDVTSGMYWALLEMGQVRESAKLMLLR